MGIAAVGSSKVGKWSRHLLGSCHAERSEGPAVVGTLHGRYAAYWNAGQHSSGHVWQGRFYSCPLDEPHLWRALRYTELNPVRAGLVSRAARWEWSSAAAHCGAAAPAWLELEGWRKRWTPAEWAAYLAATESPEEFTALRRFTHTGRPLGNTEFVAALEQSTSRVLRPQKRGRAPRPTADARQAALPEAA